MRSGSLTTDQTGELFDHFNRLALEWVDIIFADTEGDAPAVTAEIRGSNEVAADSGEGDFFTSAAVEDASNVDINTEPGAAALASSADGETFQEDNPSEAEESPSVAAAG